MPDESTHSQGGAVVLDGPYAGADLGLARRGTAGVAVVSGALSLVLFFFAAPARSLGAGGLVLGVVLSGATLLAGLALTHPERPTSFGHLAALQASAMGALGVLVWLTGGDASPQISLLLLWVILAAAAHPARRAVPLVVLATLSSVAPVVYDGVSSSQAGEPFGRLAVWLFGAAIATSLLVADLHCFKDVNDRFGHLVGDQCLQEVAASLHRSMRGADRIYRWGGDEFAILLPNVPGRRAQTLCERIAEAVAERCTDPEGNALELGCGGSNREWR